MHTSTLVVPTLVLTRVSVVVVVVVARVWLEVVRGCDEAGETLGVVAGEFSKLVVLKISSNFVSKVIPVERDWLMVVSRGWLEVVRGCDEADESSKMGAFMMSSKVASKVISVGRDWLAVISRGWLQVVRGCREAGELFRLVAGESSKLVVLMISSNVVSKVISLGRDCLTEVSRGWLEVVRGCGEDGESSKQVALMISSNVVSKVISVGRD